MTDLTAKWELPYSTTDDTIESIAATMQSLAGQLDLLMGEAGSFLASPAADTTLTQAIALSRVYPGNTAANPPGIVSVWVADPAIAAANNFNIWVPSTSWTGSGTTVTGFSISMRWTSAQVNRRFYWAFRPLVP